MIPIKKSLKKQPTKQMQHKKTKPKNQNAIQTEFIHSLHSILSITAVLWLIVLRGCYGPRLCEGRVMLCKDLQKCFLLFGLAQTILILISIYGDWLPSDGMDDTNRP